MSKDVITISKKDFMDATGKVAANYIDELIKAAKKKGSDPSKMVIAETLELGIVMAMLTSELFDKEEDDVPVGGQA